MWPRCAASVSALIAAISFGTGACLSSAAEPTASHAEEVTIPLNPLPFDVRGLLRRPEGAGPFPGVILIPACERFVEADDQNWGVALTSWGYVALTLDVFTPHGVTGRETCINPVPPDIAADVYRGLDLLVARKLVDPERVFVVGFGRGGSLVFAAIDRDGITQKAKHKFRAAAAFYPPCSDVQSVMSVPTLIMVGARNERTLDACRKLAQGEDDMGISRQHGAGAPIRLVVLPDASSGFDLPAFQKPADVRGLHVEYSKAATEQSKEVLRQFLQQQ